MDEDHYELEKVKELLFSIIELSWPHKRNILHIHLDQGDNQNK